MPREQKIMKVKKSKKELEYGTLALNGGDFYCMCLCGCGKAITKEEAGLFLDHNKIEKLTDQISLMEKAGSKADSKKIKALQDSLLHEMYGIKIKK